MLAIHQSQIPARHETFSPLVVGHIESLIPSILVGKLCACMRSETDGHGIREAVLDGRYRKSNSQDNCTHDAPRIS
jgi:hypothetical protein